MNSGNYSINNVQITSGHESEAVYHGDLCFNDIKIAEFDEDDWGGPPRIQFDSETEEERLKNFLIGQTTEVDTGGGTLEIDIDLFVSLLCYNLQQNRR